MRVDVLARRWGGPDGGPDGMAVAVSFLAWTLCELGHEVRCWSADGEAPWQHRLATWQVRPGLVAPDDASADLIITTLQPTLHRLHMWGQSTGALERILYWHHCDAAPEVGGMLFAAPPAVIPPADAGRSILLPPASWASEEPGERTGAEVLVPGASVAKGGHVALEVARRRPDLRFLVLPGRCSMQDLAGWRQLAHAEVAAGHLPPRTFLARAAAVLSPTRFDVHPLVLVEAVAWGIPVVCSDLEGTRCAAGLGALYVDRAAPTDAWAGALRTVLEQPRPRLRQRPYAEVVQAALGELELRRAA